MIIKLRVTTQDIKEGIRGNCGFCPIARRLRRRYRGKWVVHPVHADVLTPEIVPIILWWDKATTDWIANFDSGMPVKPFVAIGEVRDLYMVEELRSLEKVKKPRSKKDLK